MRLEYEKLVSSVGISLLKATPKDHTGRAINAGALSEDGISTFLASDNAYRYYYAVDS